MSKPVPFSTTIEVRDTCLCLHVQRAARVLARLFDEALQPFDLTNGQFSLLMALNRPHPPRLRPVAHLLGMDRTTLTAALKPLQRQGLVEVRPDPEDGRSRLLLLTQEGEARLAAAVPVWRAVHARIEAALPGGDAAALRAGLVALGTRPGEEAQGAKSSERAQPYT
ncbi:MarR family winged helix-turn-helix transcriptional regulator [Ancylobacter defluvii]|uniref:MarR family transcriptional regulator n=1 Tax=Ancylobacter defluvii TaxID=1282440 RepID=A0A9W6NCD5_9HYPH|nr:MarR family winged helix-turn-helix transcriptional regulator [Ancylobacter defluvii]MBS7586238.1 winged helix-turn-helix transcriptional regulator [Ancylobacter defluvii]GLK85512.1 MarR family transcriptional regulator [Ancylobacter defluvii]